MNAFVADMLPLDARFHSAPIDEVDSLKSKPLNDPERDLCSES